MRPLVVAHRGASWDAPENTLEAFALAVAHGADALELDVRATRDGELVVCHDSDVDRTTDGCGHVRELTLEQVRALDAGAGERVPTLSEVLELAAGRVRVFLELKEPADEAVDVVAAALAALDRHALRPSEGALLSFDASALRRARALRPQVPVIQLLAGDDGDEGALPLVAEYAAGVAVHERAATPAFLERADSVGLAVAPYTVNEPGRMREFAAAGVWAIITDRPALLAQVLAEET